MRARLAVGAKDFSEIAIVLTNLTDAIGGLIFSELSRGALFYSGRFPKILCKYTQIDALGLLGGTSAKTRQGIRFISHTQVPKRHSQNRQSNTKVEYGKKSVGEIFSLPNAKKKSIAIKA